MQRLIAAVDAHDDADHIPLIVDQNPQVPSRIARLVEGTGDDPGPVLVRMAERLAVAGAEALAMPCNTAHHYLPAIRAAVPLPFIDMVALSALRARALAGSGATVGILGSPALRRIGLFDAALAAHGLRPAYAGDEAAVLAAIRRIKASGPDAPARAVLLAVSARLVADGARVQMIACTEFSLIADAVAAKAQAFDTLDVLVEGIRDFALAPGARTETAAE